MANEQTSVPLFVADTILTAAQQNISAGTGVPVFATTVTRDAAFGGANTALAEGQLCYLSSTNVVQYYDGAAWATVGPAATSGLTCVKAETAITAATSVTADSVFTSTYTNYLIKLFYNTSTSNEVLMKFRVGGVSTSTNYNRQVLVATGTTTQISQGTGQTSVNLGGTAGDFKTSFDINLYNIQVATPTLYFAYGPNANANYTTGIASVFFAGNQSASTQFDGIEFLTATGTFTGTYAIYGYSKAV